MAPDLRKSGRITAFSFAFAVLKEHRRDDKVNVLTELDVLDVTITPSPPNRNAQLVSVKSHESDPEPTSEIDRINRQLDELAGPVVRKAQPGQVEAFLLEEKQRYVEEKLAEAEQAAWEGRMDVNAVLYPVPIRVDARMRPVGGEEASPSV